MVTFVNAKQQIKKLPLSSDLESKDPSMYKRLQYAKEILLQMINKNSGNKLAYQTTTTIDKAVSNFEKTQQPDILANSLAQNLRPSAD